MNNKYELAIIKDLENKKLSVVELVLKLVLETAFLGQIIKTQNEAYKESFNENIDFKELCLLTNIFNKEKIKSRLRISKLMRIIAIR